MAEPTISGTAAASYMKNYDAARSDLAARVKRLQTLRANAVRVGNVAAVKKIDDMLKRAAELDSKARSIDTALGNMRQVWADLKGAAGSGWDWLKNAVGLGELGAVPLVIGAAVVGAIGTFVYAVRTWAAEHETLQERIEAENAAIERKMQQGATRQQAAAEVGKASQNLTEENKAGGLLQKMADNALVIAFAAGGLWFLTRKKSQ